MNNKRSYLVLLAILFLALICACAGKTHKPAACASTPSPVGDYLPRWMNYAPWDCKTDPRLDPEKLLALLDEVLVDDKLGGQMKEYNLDVAKYKGPWELSCDEEFGLLLGPWAIRVDPENHYEMVLSLEYGRNGNEFVEDLEFYIYFDAGEKYSVTNWDVVKLWGQIKP